MRAEYLLDGIQYELIRGSLEVEVCDITDDSRQVSRGAVFVCMPGPVTDGHIFIGDAIRRGAAGIIVTCGEIACKQDVTCEIDNDATKYSDIGLESDVALSENGDLNDFFVAKLPDWKNAVGRLCNNFWNFPSRKMKVIAVTGTKGKTTVAYMMKKVLDTWGCCTGLIGTIEIYDGHTSVQSVNTTPDVITLYRTMYRMVQNGVRYCVMEVSSQGLKYGRISGVDFDVGIFTNISPDHIGVNEHKTFEEYVRCKGILFSKCSHVVVNIDDMYMQSVCGALICFGADKSENCPVIGYSLDHHSKIYYDKCIRHMPVCSGLMHFPVCTADKLREVIGESFVGTECECTMPDGKITKLRVGLPGSFNVYNALAVVAASDILKIPRNIVCEALAEVNVRGRMEKVNVSDAFNVYIDYAHNRKSLETALATLRTYCTGRLICIFGCGGDRARGRRAGMGNASGMLADLTIITNDNPRSESPDTIINDIEKGLRSVNAEYIRVPDRKEAIRYGLTHAKAGDVVLLAGKGHETYQEIDGYRFHMDERELIMQILEEEDAGVICGRDN